jgi:hypothetical protein
MNHTDSEENLVQMKESKGWSWTGIITVSLLSGILVVGVANVIGTFELANAVEDFKNSLTFHIN